jgi:hypothetical protein
MEAMLADHCRLAGLEGKPGLSRVLVELVQGIVWSGSVQLTNAARRCCWVTAKLEKAVKRMSDHLGDKQVDHHPWLQQLER